MEPRLLSLLWIFAVSQCVALRFTNTHWDVKPQTWHHLSWSDDFVDHVNIFLYDGLVHIPGRGSVDRVISEWTKKGGRGVVSLS